MNSVGLGLAVRDALRDITLATTSADANAEDDVSLLGLIAQTTSLIWARWSSCTMDCGKLANQISDAENAQISNTYRYSQERKRSKNLKASHCFFL